MELVNSIRLDYSAYEKLIKNNSKQLFINANGNYVAIPRSIIYEFISNKEYMETLKSSLMERVNIELTLTQSDEILLKKVYSPISIILGIKLIESDLTNEELRNFKVLLDKANLKKYLTKNKDKEYTIEIDNKTRVITYKEIFAILLDKKEYDIFINSKGKYNGYFKEEFVYLLINFIAKHKIFLSFILDEEVSERYQYLIKYYDIEAINKYTTSDSKLLDKYEISEELFNDVTANLPSNVSNLEKIILLYLNLHNYLTFDFEIDDESDKIKKHKDYSRIVEINKTNNRVFSYEFSSVLAKILFKLGFNFEYNDKYILTRIGKYIVRFKSISENFNSKIYTDVDLLKGVTLKNFNKETINKFNKIYNKIYKKAYQDRIDLELLNLSFKDSINIYRTISKKITLPFKDKYHIFLKLIENVNLSYNAIAYVYEIKKIIFNASELNSNISFAIISEKNGRKIEPIVIITINFTNINLYNSNEYIYYNPPKKIRKLDLKGIRQEFFKGNFEYIKDTNDNIIGVEKLG